LEVGKACSAIKDTLSKIVEKQYDLADNFIELVDEVLRVESNNLEDETNVPQQTRNSDDSVGQSSKYHYFSYMQNSIQSTF
jgi:DNA-binding NtrC family response regulator